MKRLVLLALCWALPLSAQMKQESYDSAAVARINDEGMNHSQVMDILSSISDVYGPRLTWSPGFLQAAKWVRSKMSEIGLNNAHLEAWAPVGRGWQLKHFSANVTGRQTFPLTAYPKAWAPGVRADADVVWFDAATDSAVQTYRGKIKGKFVLLNDPRDLPAPFDPAARRDADSTLLTMANAEAPQPRGGGRRGGGPGGFRMTPEMRQRALVEYEKFELCQTEGAAGVLTISRGDGGNIFVQQAAYPRHPDTSFTQGKNGYDPKAPRFLPQFSVGAEHYNRLVRMIRKGEHPKLDIDCEVSFSEPDSGYNIIGEIPGTDLKDEVVMIGAHFDSWHGGTGATDNGTGSSVCLEAMRILKALDLKPRRTIRIGLWGGEEEGLIGSEQYVKAHLGEREAGGSGAAGQPGELKLKPDAEKFDVYFNNDNGSGKVRGVYLQGNEDVRPIFRSWLKPFRADGAWTLSLQNTGGTDHLSFDGIGLPGFQFIQDPLDYDTRTHHSTMDLYDRGQPDDLKEASVIMAAFAYDAAMRDAKLPRKPMPQTQRGQAGSQ